MQTGSSKDWRGDATTGRPGCGTPGSHTGGAVLRGPTSGDDAPEAGGRSTRAQRPAEWSATGSSRWEAHRSGAAGAHGSRQRMGVRAPEVRARARARRVRAAARAVTARPITALRRGVGGTVLSTAARRPPSTAPARTQGRTTATAARSISLMKPGRDRLCTWSPAMGRRRSKSLRSTQATSVPAAGAPAVPVGIAIAAVDGMRFRHRRSRMHSRARG